jgi:hypothetical protein
VCGEREWMRGVFGVVGEGFEREGLLEGFLGRILWGYLGVGGVDLSGVGGVRSSREVMGRRWLGFICGSLGFMG